MTSGNGKKISQHNHITPDPLQAPPPIPCHSILYNTHIYIYQVNSQSQVGATLC